MTLFSNFTLFLQQPLPLEVQRGSLTVLPVLALLLAMGMETRRGTVMAWE